MTKQQLCSPDLLLKHLLLVGRIFVALCIWWQILIFSLSLCLCMHMLGFIWSQQKAGISSQLPNQITKWYLRHWGKDFLEDPKKISPINSYTSALCNTSLFLVPGVCGCVSLFQLTIAIDCWSYLTLLLHILKRVHLPPPYLCVLSS